MSYTTTLFKIDFSDDRFHLKGREAMEFYEILKKAYVSRPFDKREVGNFILSRQLSYTEEGTNLISINFKAKIQEITEPLTGEEELGQWDRVQNIFSGSILRLTPIPWEDVSETKIEATKDFIAKKGGRFYDEVKMITRSKYLYLDGYENLYFPRFLKKVVDRRDSDISNKSIRSYITLKPAERKAILTAKFRELITPLLKENGIKIVPFTEFKKLKPPIFLGRNGVTIHKNSDFAITNIIKKSGFYRGDGYYNIAVLDTTGNLQSDHIKMLLSREFGRFGITLNIEFTSSKIDENPNEFQLEKRVRDFIDRLKDKFESRNFIPFVIHCKESKNYRTLYRVIKKAMIQEEFPSQFLSLNSTRQSEKSSQYYFLNIVLGVSAKYGDIPYLLNRETDLIDFYIGFDVSRREVNGKMKNVSGGTYFFSEQGEFKGAKKVELSGENITKEDVGKIFGSKLEGKRIVIHRDGNPKVNEIAILRDYFEAYNIKAHLIYLTKRHNIRVFKNGDSIENPEKGVFFKYGERSAVLVTSESDIGTRQPLKVEYFPINDEPLDFDRVLQDVLDLTYMSYSSYKDTKLPVTTYYSHQIADLLSQGIEPETETVLKPYWL